MNKIVNILTCLQNVFVPGQIILFYISTRLILIYQNPEIWKSSSNWIDWSWILLPYHDTGFLFIGWQLFEYHLVTEFTHVCSLSFSSSTLSADAYMETSSAIILRTHPSSVKLDISLMNSKNKMGPSTDPCGMPFLCLDIQMFLVETKQENKLYTVEKITFELCELHIFESIHFKFL